MKNGFSLKAAALVGVMALLASAKAGAETRYALLAGCNTYADDLTALGTSIDDIQGVKSLVLCAPGGYWDSGNVTMLSDAQATYDTVREKIAVAAKVCAAGDVFFFMYSGHGSQAYDSTYGYYESVCLYDYDYDDWQLGEDLAAFDSDVKVVVMLDTCFAAGMFKAATTNGAPVFQKFADRVMASYRQAKQAKTALVSKAALGENVAFMTSCNKDESSWAPDTGYSLYTGYVLDAVSKKTLADANGDAALSLKELHDYAVPLVIQATQRSEVQTPQSYHPEILDKIIVLGNPDVISMEADAQTVSEADGSVVVRLTRAGSGSKSASVSIQTVSESAVPGKDFVVPAQSTVTWGVGDLATKSVAIQIIDDAVKEGSETFWVLCSNPKNAVVDENHSKTVVTILDNDAGTAGTVRFASPAASVAENGGFVSLPVVRAGGLDRAAQVGYRTVSGSATAGADFGAVTGVLSWCAGDGTARSINVPVFPDAAWEDAETFSVELFDAEGITLGTPAVATVTLANSDTVKKPGVARIDPATAWVCESEGVARVTVLREGGSDGAVEARIAAVAGTAKAGVNFVATNAVLSWANGDASPRVFEVPLLNDGVYKADLTFLVKFASFKGGLAAATTGAKSTVVLRDALSTVTLADALDVGSQAVAVGGTGGWYGQTAESDGGAGAAQLYGAALTKGKDAWMQMAVTGPGVLAFSWRLAAQTNDVLAFMIGAAVKTNRVGQRDWERVEGIVVPAGKQTLKWRFVKNASVTAAGDTAWLDHVVWSPDAAQPTLPLPASGGVLASVPQQVSWQAASGAASYSVYLRTNSVAQNTLLGQTNGTAWAVSGLMPKATYYWRVDAVSAAGRVTRGAVWSFKTPGGALAVVSSPGDQAAAVGLPFVLALPLAEGSPAATSYSVKGLPAGLSALATNGVISGRPTGAVTSAVTVAAVNAFGTGPSVTFKIAVGATPKALTGSFAGLVGLGGAWADKTFFDEKLRGAVQMTVSAAGAVSGSLRLTDGTYSFTGYLAEDADGLSFEKSIKHKDGRVSLFQIRPYQDDALAQQGYRGALFSDTERQELVLTRNGWADNKPALADYAGYYTVALPMNETYTSNYYPVGTSYLTVSLNTSGAATLAGVMSDGAAWSGSSTACPAPDGRGLIIPVFSPLYSGVGQVWGTLRIAPRAPGRDDNSVEGYAAAYFGDQASPEGDGLLWISGEQPTSRLAPDGFCLGLMACGGFYNTGAMTYEARLGKASHVLSLNFDAIATTANDPTVSVALSGNTIWLPAKGVGNPCGTTLSVNGLTGIFSGSFTLRDSASGNAVTRTISYKGVLAPFQWTLGETVYESPGSGFFLVNGVDPTPATSWIDSLGAQLLWVPLQ